LDRRFLEIYLPDLREKFRVKPAVARELYFWEKCAKLSGLTKIEKCDAATLFTIIGRFFFNTIFERSFQVFWEKIVRFDLKTTFLFDSQVERVKIPDNFARH
jgi:hypothetical protein